MNFLNSHTNLIMKSIWRTMKLDKHWQSSRIAYKRSLRNLTGKSRSQTSGTRQKSNKLQHNRKELLTPMLRAQSHITHINRKLPKPALLHAYLRQRERRRRIAQSGTTLSPRQRGETRRIASLIRLLQKCCAIMQTFVESTQRTRFRKSSKRKLRNRLRSHLMVDSTPAQSLPSHRRRAIVTRQIRAIYLTCTRILQFE